MDTETAEVIGHDVTTITCVCGNNVSQNGLIQCQLARHPRLQRRKYPVPAGLAKWPEDEDLYTLCPSCGRVYRDAVMEETRDRNRCFPNRRHRRPNCRGNPPSIGDSPTPRAPQQ